MLVKPGKTDYKVTLPEPHPEQLGANLLRRTAPQKGPITITLPEPRPEQLGAKLLSRTAPQGTDHHHLAEPYPEQLGAIQSTAKRKVVRAGRRSGKAAPTSEQISRF